MLTVVPGKADGLVWAYYNPVYGASPSEAPASIVYAMRKESTRIESKHEIVYVDYGNLRLHRYDKTKKECRTFPLNDPVRGVAAPADPDEAIRVRKQSLLASFHVFPGDGQQQIGSYNCTVKSILFGSEMTHLLVKAPTIERLGQAFTAARVDYCVSTELPELDLLKRFASDKRPVYEANPLLRQIDLVGLLEPLGGFPVVVTKGVGENQPRADVLQRICTKEADDAVFDKPAACR